MFALLFLLVLCVTSAPARPQEDLEDKLHPNPKLRKPGKLGANSVLEEKANFWNENAQDTIRNKLRNRPIESVAKNVIIFLGDGMSIPTLAATRAYYGGEELELSFEKLPYTALSKTYCVNAQTADSACSATAYLTGVKNNFALLGVTAAVKLNDCDASVLEENQVESIAKWSQDVGKRTGIVTISTVTDASPAGAYAKVANRKWQTDTAIIKNGGNATKCRDITYQLVKSAPGKNFNVILGGGIRKWLNNDTRDQFGERGQRSDNLNLIEEWINDRYAEGKQAAYVPNRAALLNLEDNIDYVLGLFSSSFMPYNLERNATLTPSLEEMTEVAIKMVSKGNGAENGYFLFIEGGRIDHGHHASWAKKAFDETIEFAKAIQKALDMTSEEDTLIVVTADHAHTMSVSGYPARGNNILGVAGVDDGVARLTLNYANGPAPVNTSHDYGTDNTNDLNYRFPGVSYLSSETHGGDDVGIYARGPWAHLFSGVLEQNVIPHIMAYASCVGDGVTAPACSWAVPNVASFSSNSVPQRLVEQYVILLGLFLLVVIYF